MRVGSSRFNIRELAGLMGATGAMIHVARWTPKSVVCDIQLSPGVLLSLKGLEMLSGCWLLGMASVFIVLVLRGNHYAPAALMVVRLGVAIMGGGGKLTGLAGQCSCGARTSRTNIIQGTTGIGLGLFLAGSIATLFAAFPMGIVGAMILMVGVELFTFARELRLDLRMIPLGATVIGSVALNMAVGFAADMILHYLVLARPGESADAN